jgi:hypothetical protein
MSVQLLGSKHRVDMGSISDVPDMYAASIFRVEMFRMGDFLCVTRFMF